jgi:hypothetical protein
VGFVHFSVQQVSEREPVVDFLSDDFLELRRNTANFTDRVHLNNAAARQVVAVVNLRLSR